MESITIESTRNTQEQNVPTSTPSSRSNSASPSSLKDLGFPSSTPTQLVQSAMPTLFPTSNPTFTKPFESLPSSMPTTTGTSFPSGTPTKWIDEPSSSPSSAPSSRPTHSIYSPSVVPSTMPSVTNALLSRHDSNSELSGSDIAGILAVLVFAGVLILCVCYKHKQEERYEDPEDNDQQPLSMSMREFHNRHSYRDNSN